MANGFSDISTAQRNPGRLVVIPGQRLFSPVKHARFEITLLGNETANEWHELCQRLTESGYQIIPEQCRIRHISGTYSLVSKLQRVNAAGTATDITAGLTHANGTAASSLAFAATANTEPAVLSDTDSLRIQFTTVTTTNAAAKFVVELAFRTVEA
jgi:hypothetical protein